MTAVTAELCAFRVGEVLRQAYGDQRNVAKRITKKITSTPRAFQNYYYGKAAPPMATLIQLMAECHELEADILRLVSEVREARR